VGYIDVVDGAHATEWSGGSRHQPGRLPGSNDSFATGINDAGKWRDSASGSMGFKPRMERWHGHQPWRPAGAYISEPLGSTTTGKWWGSALSARFTAAIRPSPPSGATGGSSTWRSAGIRGDLCRGHQRFRANRGLQYDRRVRGRDRVERRERHRSGDLPWFIQSAATVSMRTGSGGLQLQRHSPPESSTWAMMLLGFAGLTFAGHRRARAGGAILAG